MHPHGTLPLELVDQVIDELGEAFRKGHFNARPALLACSLVSKTWTVRSRSHMFRRVEINGRKVKPTSTPASIVQYVKELEVLYYGKTPAQTASIADFLKAFATAPIECLRIMGMMLFDKRTCILECIEAHFATLERLEFQHCSLSPHNISDIVLGRHRLESLSLISCGSTGQRSSPPGGPDTHLKPSDMELCISGPVDVVTMVAGLPHRFRKLDVLHIVTEEETTTEAMNALIKANGDVLSSLRARIWAGVFETSS